MISLFGVDPACWRPHPVHADDRAFTESNCYADVVIETVAAAGDEPLAMLGAAVTVDFELDQWTFFKPRPEDLRRLYGIDVHEMQPYRPLAEQIAQRLEAGETLVVEVDAFHLPDTAATSYAVDHVKTSIVPEAIDPAAGVLRYFHNAGFYELSGDDYAAVASSAGFGLPPYVDVVRFGGARPSDVRRTAHEVLTEVVALRPGTNPFHRYAAQLEAELPSLQAGALADYHAYAFATARMAGASFELLGSHLTWLYGDAAAKATTPLAQIVSGSKLLVFRLARRRPFDIAAVLDPMAAQWDDAMAAIDALVHDAVPVSP